MNLLPFLTFLLLPHGPIQDASQDAAMLPVALKKLDAMKDPDIVANRDTLRAVLERFYLHRETMKSSEFKLVQAFLDAASEGRGGSSNDLAAMLRGAAPAAPPKKAAGAAGGLADMLRGSGGKATKKKVKAAPVVRREKVVRKDPPPVKTRPKALDFLAQTHLNPGGVSVGVVAMRRGAGAPSPLIEVYPGGGLGVDKRAKVIADRFDRLQAIDPNWWMKLKVGTFGNSTIVASPRAEKGIVVTADKSFAEACGTDPAGLARMLIRKIRDGIEPSTTGSRALGDPETSLADAVDARQRGDALAAKDPEGAAQAYQEAIDTAPAYVVPYLRLAALRAERGDKDAAKEILNKGLAADGMTEDGKTQINAALAKLGA